MGYEITYYPICKKQYKNRTKNNIPVFTFIFFLLFFVVSFFYWPQGRTALQTILIPGDSATTISAVRELVSSLANGENLKASIDVFCITVLDGAGLALH